MGDGGGGSRHRGRASDAPQQSGHDALPCILEGSTQPNPSGCSQRDIDLAFEFDVGIVEPGGGAVRILPDERRIQHSDDPAVDEIAQ
ncbi:hypothetical protein D092_10675 [Rhodococcus ruber Chol-4]|nr:hypothetical protein D092_10675 [Rhodococcus ruber Chol-4]